MGEPVCCLVFQLGVPAGTKGYRQLRKKIGFSLFTWYMVGFVDIQQEVHTQRKCEPHTGSCGVESEREEGRD